jgi:hypothetical protein
MPIGLSTAIIGSAVVGGGIAALGSASAAHTQANAATQAAASSPPPRTGAADMQLGMFNTIRDDLSPYRTAGGAALPGYMALLGIPASAYSGAGAPAPSGFSAGSLAGAATQPGQDWNAYLSANPDIAAYYNQNAAQLQQMGYATPQAYAQWHYQNIGQGEGRGFGAASSSSSAYPNADWAAYLKANPDVAAYEQADAAKRGIDPNDPGEIASVAQWHYGTYGTGEGRALPSMATGSAATMPNAGQSIQDFLAATPGYQFTRDQGMQAVENQLSARGLGGLSGALGKGLSRFVTGLADQTYQSQLENYRTAAGMGQSAANQTGAFGQTATTNAGGALVGAAGAQAAGITGAAQANANGIVGGANAISGALGSIPNSMVTGRILGMYGAGAGAPTYSATNYPGIDF